MDFWHLFWFQAKLFLLLFQAKSRNTMYTIIFTNWDETIEITTNATYASFNMKLKLCVIRGRKHYFLYMFYHCMKLKKKGEKWNEIKIIMV